uniref:Uncharacterized protein n=1 Tax=Kalanchoe fedtschenkoi TaxID=63787 RepID=A0A7N0UTK2_KALFE
MGSLAFAGCSRFSDSMGTNEGSDGAMFDCLLFDMDDTLYPLSLGINLACRLNIQEYMLNELQIEESVVPKMCLDLYREHGTTMAGLKVLGYKFDDDDFHAYVHGRLPYHKLKPDPVLRNLLLSMPQRKIIFTNADRAHVGKVLLKLGLEDCFEGVICFETLNPYNDGSRVLCKPSVEAMKAAIKIANVDAHRILFFDDSARNIASGKEAGMSTVLVGSSRKTEGADFALTSIHNMKEGIPEIWGRMRSEDQSDEHMVHLHQPSAVETVQA